MEKLRAHYTGTTGSSLLTDRFKFWTSCQRKHESIQEWEVKVRQASSLCGYGKLNDELSRDKFIFGLSEEQMRTELLKTNIKPDTSKKTLTDVVSEAKSIESAKKTSKLIADSSAKGIEEEVHWTGLRHSQMKLRRDPETCFGCGDRRGPHPWKECPANGKSCSKCAGNDHFARVCLEEHNPQASGSNQRQQQARGRPQARGYNQRSRRGYPRARASPRPRDVHYTDICEEQQYGSAPNPDYGFDMYALEAQVHNIDTYSPSKSPGKRYFTTLKAYYDKTAGTQQRSLDIGNYAYAKPRPNQRGQPWRYGEVVEKDETARSYTIRTPRGINIRRNRVQLRPAAPPPTDDRLQMMVMRYPASEPYIANPAQFSQPTGITHNTPQIHKSQVSSHQAEEINKSNPMDGLAVEIPLPQDTQGQPETLNPARQTRSGREVKTPQRLKDYLLK
ncbi:uncharacterized protein LOC116606358 [Nematostella vectensis]|uniref:uncharacterized protein LOC116606358 n=1 Tax=Nematostella vectensis TaxID=45351 RepID=UPI0020778EFA|nr:uncharacterized protein LOC116606358 [Nematostella vectensis]